MTSPVTCPFCDTQFTTAEDWCPHYLGVQADLTLDDYKDFISGHYPAETVADDDGEAHYFMNRFIEDSEP